MNENAQILAFADQLIQEINDAQLEIELLEKVAKFRKDAFAAKIDSELANDVEKSQALINEKKAMLLPIIQKQLEGKNKNCSLALLVSKSLLLNSPSAAKKLTANLSNCLRLSKIITSTITSSLKNLLIGLISRKLSMSLMMVL